MDINVTKEIATSYFLQFYQNLESIIPPQYRIFINIAFYTILIAIYGIFIWKFYRFLARRDIFKLDLNKYNNISHAGFNKVVEILAFFVKFLILFPLIIFFWFTVLAVFLVLLSESKNVASIIMVSAAIVGAVRLTSYISEDLSKDLAKMFPFTLLGVFLLNPDFFSMQEFIIKINQIPQFFLTVPFYLIFIFGLEIIMRVGFIITKAIKGDKKERSEEETQEQDNSQEIAL